MNAKISSKRTFLSKNQDLLGTGLLALIALTLRCPILRLDEAQALPGHGGNGNSDGNATAWYLSEPFMQMLEKHEAFGKEFRMWRSIVAENGKELAIIVRDLPGGDLYSEETLCGIFSGATVAAGTQSGEDIFAPWTSRWSGTWSNGVRQFHIWNATLKIGGKWVQPVSMSETKFVELCCAGKMARRNQVDLAINVFSPDTGVTGWVSKVQHGRLEMPHIGYPLDDSTLVWICQIRKPGELFHRSNEWFVFMESIRASLQGTEYRIYGSKLKVNKDTLNVVDGRDKHFGTYHAG